MSNSEVSRRVFDSSPIVQGDAGRWAELFRGARRQVVRRGRVIIQPGEPCDELHYLEAGRVVTTLAWHDGTEKVIGVVLPGTIFGEMCFFRPDLATTTVRAHVDSVVRLLPRADVEEYLRANPALGLDLINTLSRKTWVLIRQIEDLRFRSVEARVASLLYTLAAHGAGGDEPAARPEGAVVRLTHAGLADLVGAHRVSVSNTLLAFQSRGFIELRPRRIVIKDAAALYEIGFPSTDTKKRPNEEAAPSPTTYLPGY